VVSVDGSDRTLGEKVARQILVRVAPDRTKGNGKKASTANTNRKARKEPV
jgi:hypothetical protein